VQIECMTQGNGWNLEEGRVHLVAALCSATAEVLTTIPDSAVSVPNIIATPKHRFKVERQNDRTSLLNLSLRYENESPLRLLENWHTIFTARLGSCMRASAQESLALDYFIQALPDPDLRAHLSIWCLATMRELADTAAHWEAAKPLACGGERHPVTVRQVGPANNGGSGKGVAPRATNLEWMVQEMVDRQLRSGPWQVAPVMVSGKSPGNTQTQNYRGRNLDRINLTR